MPIRAEGQYTVVDIVHRRWGESRRALILYLIAGLLALAGGVFLTMRYKGGWRDALALFAACIYLSSFFVLTFYRAVRQIKRTPNLQGTVNFEFGEDGYRMIAPHSTADIKWSALVRWKEGERSFVIYPGGGFIPKRFFQSRADVDAFRELLQAKVKKR